LTTIVVVERTLVVVNLLTAGSLEGITGHTRLGREEETVTLNGGGQTGNGESGGRVLHLEVWWSEVEIFGWLENRSVESKAPVLYVEGLNECRWSQTEEKRVDRYENCD
jgi:hypothetical protein